MPVLTALAGPVDGLVATALAGRREVVVARRCADVAELVSTAEAGLGRVVLLSAGFDRLDGDVVLRLHRAGCAVVGVVEPGGQAPEPLMALGAADLVDLPVAAGTGGSPEPVVAERLARAVVAAAGREASRETGRSGYGEPRFWNIDDEVPAGEREVAPALVSAADATVQGPAGSGQLLTVWGPPGSPGRTTVAATLAAELAATGEDVLLVDADTHASSTAQLLGLLDESAGIVAAVRAGAEGRLDAAALARLSPLVLPHMRVLTGIVRGARWPELRPAGVAALWLAARNLVRHVVVDVAAPLEEDEELVFDTVAPRRNGLTLDAVRGADHLLAVGSADPVGLQRLVRALQELAVAAPDAVAQVVVNRVRASAVGRRPELRVRDALSRFAGLDDVHLVPDDRDAFDHAVLAGRTVTEHEPNSPARLAIAALARRLRGPAAQPPRGAGASRNGSRGRRRPTLRRARS